MGQTIQFDRDIAFSPRMIELQLERIYLDPHFNESKILRKFLSFIVEETMLGRANCLKEYTIALSVLEKPPGFRPKENGIVRIHAGRLRRALHQYYSVRGIHDQIVISIPKGQYVPVFSDRKDISCGADFTETLNAHQLCVDNTGTMRLAVLPFIGCSWGESQRAFGDNLCVQLSSALMRLDKVAVIAYQVVQSAAVGNPDYRELSASFGLTHFLTGGAQRHKDVFRVSMQLIECHTYRQLWAGTIECGVTRSDVFDFQDAICNCAAKGVAELER